MQRVRGKMRQIDVRSVGLELLRQPPLSRALATLAQGSNEAPSKHLDDLIQRGLCEVSAPGPRVTRLGRSLAYHLAEYRTQIEAGAAAGFVSKLELRRDSRVLDVGCGAGQSLVALMRGQPRMGVGLEFDEVALAMFAALRDFEGTTNAIPVRGDAERLPFGNASFDRVLCRVVLMHVRVLPTLAEIARVCAPGGLVYLHLTDFWFYWRKLLRGRWERGGVPFALANGLLLQLLGRQIRMRATRTMNYQTVATVIRRLERLGFEILSIERQHEKPLAKGYPQPKILARRLAPSKEKGA